MINAQTSKKQTKVDFVPFNVDVNIFNAISSVASGATNDIVTYTVPVGKTFALELVEFSGENIANYIIYVDTDIVAYRRTWFGGSISGEFTFEGYRIAAGKVITLKVNNFRPSSADFEGRILGGLI